MSQGLWDQYFLKICNTVAMNGKCLSRKFGAIVVSDKSILSTGYNGPPRGVSPCSERYYKDPYFIEKLKKYFPFNEETWTFTTDLELAERIDKTPELKNSLETKCPRYFLGYKSGEGLDLCVAGHAERNALINAARTGTCVKGSTMFMNCGIPCKDCLIEIINAGIDEIVCTKLEYYDAMSPYLVKESGIKIRTFDI